MDFQSALDRLRQSVAGGAKFRELSGDIRDAQGRCPLCHLAWLADPAFTGTVTVSGARAVLAARGVALDAEVVAAVVSGADGPESRWRPALKEACGL